MQTQYLIRQETLQVPPYDAASMAQGLSAQLAYFLFPLLVELDRRLDKRLVRTSPDRGRDPHVSGESQWPALKRVRGLLALSRSGSSRHQTTQQFVAFHQVACDADPRLPVAAGQRAVGTVAASRTGGIGALG